MTAETGTFDEVFGAEYPRLVRALSVADDAADVEDAVQEVAAEVDVEAGRAEQRTRQRGAARRQRSVRAVVVAATCALVVGAAVVVARARSGDDTGLQAGPDGRGDVVTGDGREAEPRTTSVEQDGLVLTVTSPAAAPAGSRMWFDVVIRNDGEELVNWEAGGCAIPIRAIVGPSSSVSFDAGGSDWDDPHWDGDVGGLATWLDEHNALILSQSFQPADETGVREIGCQGDSRMAEVAPGDEIDHRGSVELRMPPGDLPDGGNYDLLVEFQPHPAVNPDTGHSPLAPVVVRAPVTVTEDPARGGADDAIAAFTEDSRLPEWVESTAVADRPDLVQDFTTELSWWRGAWELWVDARWEGNRRLRMRYDPEGGEIVDVRTVYLGRAPEDDPDRSPDHSSEPDEIL